MLSSWGATGRKYLNHVADVGNVRAAVGEGKVLLVLPS